MLPILRKKTMLVIVEQNSTKPINVDLRKLLSLKKAGEIKNITRQHVRKLIVEEDELDGYEIDGRIYLFDNQRFQDYERRKAGRKVKS